LSLQPLAASQTFSFASMPIIIDGYNLLNVVGITGRGMGPGGLERARQALLNFLAESLEAKEIAKTIVVFDSREAPWGLPRTVLHRGLSVQYASKYPDADCLIEELIQKESAPRQLTVVSSDHRLQRAARRRRARAVDSDVWYAEILHARRVRQEKSQEAPAQPPVPLLPEDVQYWIEQFGGEAKLEEWVKEQAKGESKKDKRGRKK
jgi:predicted RNA-binding protein with PIN domain